MYPDLADVGASSQARLVPVDIAHVERFAQHIEA